LQWWRSKVTDRFLKIAGLQLRVADELLTFFDQMIAIVIWSTLINFYETDTLELSEMLMSLESTHWSDHNMFWCCTGEV
jgi:hypothetical protein